MTSIACGPRPAVSYFQTECNNEITYMRRNLLLNSINRSWSICLYRKKGITYGTSYCAINHTILFSTVTSHNSQLVKIFQVVRNLASCDIATSRGTLPIVFSKLSYQFWIIYIFVVFKNNVSVGSSNYSYYPSGPNPKISTLISLSKWAYSQIGFWTNPGSVFHELFISYIAQSRICPGKK